MMVNVSRVPGSNRALSGTPESSYDRARTILTHATQHTPTYNVAVRPNMFVGSRLGRDRICGVTS